MNIECPACNKAIDVPESWAGKRVRCLGCQEPFTVPAPQGRATGSADPMPESLGDLALLEQTATSPDDDGFETEDFEGAPSTQTIIAPEKADDEDGRTRICPHCGKTVRATDEFSAVLCSHCQHSVPARTPRPQTTDARPTPRGARPGEEAGGFYAEFLSAFLYPLPGLGSLVLGMVIAAGAIFLPVGILLGMAIGAGRNPITEAADVTWVKPLLSFFFLVEAVYFGGVGYYLLVDTIRCTGQGLGKPPPLTWNLTSVTTALIGYAGLATYYLIIGLIIIYVTNDWTLKIPTTLEDFERYKSPAYLAIFAVVTFTVPMNVIGLGSARMLEGFSPYRILISIRRTATNYCFLFLIVCLYLAIYVGLMASVVGWASDKVLMAIEAYSEQGTQSFPDVAAGLGAWSVLIGVGLYFAYVMGRLLGLFVKSYRRRLAFDL